MFNAVPGGRGAGGPENDPVRIPSRMVTFRTGVSFLLG